MIEQRVTSIPSGWTRLWDSGLVAVAHIAEGRAEQYLNEMLLAPTRALGPGRAAAILSAPLELDSYSLVIRTHAHSKAEAGQADQR
jgi:hypothetical protein